MTINELQNLKRRIEKAKIDQIKATALIENIESELMKICGTSDAKEIEEIIKKQLSQIETLEYRIKHQLEKIDQ